ncbi:MAG TPA: class I SAM-dependent methyltransferase [Bryobacteraceae bacterium]|nr:class I SAM-dependent methyltransferase [Bryobacteraceae bacterium]
MSEDYPIRVGTTEDFATVCGLLERVQFNEAEIARRLGVPLLTQVTIDDHPEDTSGANDTLSLLIGLFVHDREISAADLSSHLSPDEIAALERLGLLSNGRCPVCLCPVSNVYTISDRWTPRSESSGEAAADIVYPAVVPNTRMFLDLLPRGACDSFLELCGGTGVAALLAADECATHASAFDIAPRSTHFAEFARRLNGLDNMTTGTGDLYDPAGDATYDRIVAHPPYMPTLDPKYIFYSGGEDGEQVTRRVIEQAPKYLRPGGTLYCVAMASDREDAPLERRIRQWLGPEEREFDVAVVVRRVATPEELVTQTVMARRTDPEAAKRWLDFLRELKIIAFSYAAMIVQRKAAGREPFTVRRMKGDRTGRLEHDWLLAWETHAASDTTGEKILGSRLRAMTGPDLRVINRLKDGHWTPVQFVLETEYPFKLDMRIEPWVGHLMASCDGKKTGADLFRQLMQEEILQAQTQAADFAGVLKILVSGGFLQVC